MNRIYTLNYIEANPGETIVDCADRAQALGVECFIHNGTLYRLSAWEKVGSADPASLRRASRPR